MEQDTELEEMLIDSSTHYERTCLNCGYTWLGLHCPHDGYQNPCPSCKVKPKTIEIKEPYTVCGCSGTIDLDELKDLLIIWRDKSVNEAREDELYKTYEQTKPYMNNEDFNLYVVIRRNHLNKKGEAHEHIFRNGIDNKGEYSVCECGHKIYKKGEE